MVQSNNNNKRITFPGDDDGQKERKRGVMENRNKINKKAVSSAKTDLCLFIAQERECPKGDSCRFSHDLETFLQKNKLPDLEGVCPNIAVNGHCRFGLFCRFSSTHLQSPIKETVDTESSSSLLNKLRQKEIPFCRTNAFMRELKDDASYLDKTFPFGEKPTYKLNFCDKVYLAPLTTVGNLPFRRICKEYGVDITCGEMAMCTNILKGQASELALLRRHPSEDFFGVQVCGGWTDSMAQCAEILNEYVDCDFVDVNMGCPIDIVYKKGMGSGLMDKPGRIRQILAGMRTALTDKPLTVKMRIGIEDAKPLAQKLLPIVAQYGVDALTIHGRTRQQRYTKAADWKFISGLVDQAHTLGVRLIGNGDILSYEDYEAAKQSGVDAVMVARGALIKPWVFTEIKELRYWDIRSSERLEMLRTYCRYGLEHFGSDTAGVEKTRRFLLEWLSFLCRYVPVGILERLAPKINDRPPSFIGRDDLETLMASTNVKDWIRISEMLLGPVADDFVFLPKHKANSYEG